MKLTAEQRRNLPEDSFGIPSERRYPMPDAEHVRMAIRYFSACEVSKRKELAKNINRLAKLYGVTVKVTPANPFKHYASADIVTENAIPVVESAVQPDVFKIIKEFRDCTHDVRTFNEWHKEGQYHQLSQPQPRGFESSNSQLDAAIRIAVKNLMRDGIDKEYYLDNRGVFSPDNEVNSIKDFVYDTDLKTCYDIARHITHMASADECQVAEKIKTIHDINFLQTTYDSAIKSIGKYSPKIADVLMSPTMRPFGMDTTAIDSTMNKINAVRNGIERHDQELKSLFSEIDFTSMPCANIGIPEEVVTRLRDTPYVQDLCTAAFGTLTNDLNYPAMGNGLGYPMTLIMGQLYNDNVIDGYFVSSDFDASTQLFSLIVKMNTHYYIPVYMNKLEELPDRQYKMVVVMLKVLDEEKPEYLNISIAELIRKKYVMPRMPMRRITFTYYRPYGDKDPLMLAQEGISLSKDGDISFDLSITKSYMDKYAGCHAMLLEDRANGNYESMKHNLAYMFALIATIEDKYVGRHKEVDKDSAEYKEAIKARAFAINDFKTYLRAITKEEPKFNFMKFYKDNKYDKKVYTISAETLLGIKRLVKIVFW